MSKRIKILVIGSCWPTNIGNAFVNFGEINCLKKALGDTADVFHFGTMSTYLFWTKGLLKNDLNISNFTNFDYVVMAGMTQCSQFFDAMELVLKDFIHKGSKIIILGGGAQDYTEEEVKDVREKIKKIPIYAFVSRDKYSFDHYADLAANSLDGIDSAFFVSDNFNKIEFDFSDYNVLNFDTYNEPNIINAKNEDDFVYNGTTPGLDKINFLSFLNKKDNIETKNDIYEPPTLDMQGNAVIRTHHAPWPEFAKHEHFYKLNTLISDLPSDYLNIYSQANIVYSDRIHACVATLSFGRKTMLFGRNIARLRMFERVGAGDIMDEPVSINLEYLNLQKENQIDFVKKVISNV